MPYFVIENTPGYLPEDDQDGFDGHEDIEDARAELRDIVEAWKDDLAETDQTAEIGLAADGLSAWMSNRSGYTHDLGRVAEVVEADEA